MPVVINLPSLRLAEHRFSNGPALQKPPRSALLTAMGRGSRLKSHSASRLRVVGLRDRRVGDWSSVRGGVPSFQASLRLPAPSVLFRWRFAFFGCLIAGGWVVSGMYCVLVKLYGWFLCGGWRFCNAVSARLGCSSFLQCQSTWDSFPAFPISQHFATSCQGLAP